MSTKVMTKIIALMLAFILTFANVITLGLYMSETIAASINLEEQTNNVENANVEFDAYFEVQGERKHGKEVDMLTAKDKLHIYIKVSDGYLSNAKVEINNANFKILEDANELESVQKIENNTITFNQINSSKSVDLEIPITMNTDFNFDVRNIDRTSDVVLSGKFVNNKGQEINIIPKTIKVEAIMKAQAEGSIDINITKYVPFELNERKGVIIETEVKSCIRNNIMPVKESKIKINVPKINNIEPTRIALSAESTKATNGKEYIELELNRDYTYENGIVVLTLKNEKDANNIVSWMKSVQDIIKLTCIYGEEAKVQEPYVQFAARNLITIYDKDETVLEKDIFRGMTLRTKIGDIMTYDYKENVQELSKGYMMVPGANDTLYGEKLYAHVSNKDLVDSIIIINREKYGMQNEYDAGVLFKSTKVTKENFLSILGEAGEIKIYNNANNEIATINKDNLQYTYTSKISNIRVETSKPIREGTLIIENDRAIEAGKYDKEKMKTFTSLKHLIDFRYKAGTVIQPTFVSQKGTKLVNPKTQIETEINNNKLSAGTINKNEEIRVVLKTNDDTCDLYKNAKLTIEFPEHVKNVTNETVSILHGQGLLIGQNTVKKDTNGNVILEIKLNGEQTAFNTSTVSDGAIVVFQGDIEIKDDTQTGKDEIKIYVENDNATGYEKEESGKGNERIAIEYIAKPEETKPEETKPEETQPEETKPEEQSNDKIDVSVEMTSGGKKLEKGAKVKEGQYIDYTVSIKNKTNKDMTLDLEVSKENGKFYGPQMVYYDILSEQEIHINKELEDEVLTQTIKLDTNKIYKYKYTIVVNKKTAGSFLKNRVSIKENGSNIIEDIIINNNIEEGFIKLNLSYNGTEEVPVYSNGVMPLVITVTNISDTDLNNINIELDLGTLFTYIEVENFESANNHNGMKYENNIISYFIKLLEKDKEIKIFLQTEVGSIETQEEYRDISLEATATIENHIIKSNQYKRRIKQGEALIKATMTGNQEGEYVKDGDELIYSINIENAGIIKEDSLTIKDVIPECLRMIEYKIIDSSGNEKKVDTNYNNLSIINLELPSRSKMTIIIKTIVCEGLANNNIIENKATLSGTFFEKFNTNTVTYKLRNVSGEKNENKTNAISGRIWNDANDNGKRDKNEKLLSDVKVMLMNSKTKEFIKDTKGIEQIISTNKDGLYKFEELENGEYIVIFVYDTEKYKSTIYQKNDINENQNSDAIDGKVYINGKEIKVAISDIIKINNSTKENVDLGLVELKKFDLSINKEVKTVIVQNGQGTQVYNIKDGKYAKVEIPSKYMKGTTISIEYVITIKNEGDIPGKVQKIVDYMPRNLEFSSEINMEWYKGTDGKLYTEEFNNTVLNPGETKEITLVLTKKLNEEKSLIISNTAEIFKTHNDNGAIDIDSTPGNNASDEDDLSKADLVITIKTGVVTYTLFVIHSILIIGLFAGGIYTIKKKVLTLEN